MNGYNVYEEEVQAVQVYGHNILKLVITASIIILILVGLWNLLGNINGKAEYEKFDKIVRQVSSSEGMQYEEMTYVGKIDYDQHRFRDAYTHRFYLTGITSSTGKIPAAYMDVDVEVTDCSYPKTALMKFAPVTLDEAQLKRIHSMSRNGELTWATDPIKGGVVSIPAEFVHQY